MKQTRIIMGMPVTVEVIDPPGEEEAIEKIFAYFEYIDEKFSTYKNASEIMKINRGELKKSDYSEDMKTILALSEKTKKETNGYFDIVNLSGEYDPSGLVKGWAIHNAAKILERGGFKNFYVDAGGDIQTKGLNRRNKKWRVGIRNPFNIRKNMKIIYTRGEGVATSGTYIRGQHIYNPKTKNKSITEIVSLTIIGPNIYEADRFATAAFAMGRDGIYFIENMEGLEGYMVDQNGLATITSGFDKYTKEYA